MNKNVLLAFFLAFIPGMGHLYLGKKRGVLYALAAFGPLFLGIFMALANPRNAEEFALLGALTAFFVGFVNMVDMIITLLRRPNQAVMSAGAMGMGDNGNHSVSGVGEGQHLAGHSAGEGTAQWGSTATKLDDNERFFAIILSFIPGLGHFYMGLMNRGLTFLIGFFGLATMIIFLTAVTNQGGFIAFLGILPIIWIFNMFDTVNLLSKKARGEVMEDRTILEDFEQNRREAGRKSRALATILSIFPGAGHMYLGLQKRGFQLMAGFLLAVYILDILRLSIFLFLIPLIWFYSFFDALQKVSKHGEEDIEDVPVITYLINHQRWIGIGLLVLGLYYLIDHMFIPALEDNFSRWFGINLSYYYYNYFQTAVVSILLIGGGIKLIAGSKGRNGSNVSKGSTIQKAQEEDEYNQ